MFSLFMFVHHIIMVLVNLSDAPELLTIKHTLVVLQNLFSSLLSL